MIFAELPLGKLTLLASVLISLPIKEAALNWPAAVWLFCRPPSFSLIEISWPRLLNVASCAANS